MIEDGKPIGVVLTMEEYELLRNKDKEKIEKEIMLETELPTNDEKPKPIVNSINPVGAAIVDEMNFPEASAPTLQQSMLEGGAPTESVGATIDEINLADAGDVTLEDLGLDELPY